MAPVIVFNGTFKDVTNYKKVTFIHRAGVVMHWLSVSLVQHWPLNQKGCWLDPIATMNA